MQIQGTLKLIRPTQIISDKFSKREFVVVTDEQYPQSIQLELQGQNCDIIDAYAEGQKIVCGLNLRGRLWVNKEGVDVYFNTVVCWKIQPEKSENQPEVYHANHPTNTPPSTMGNPRPYNSFADEPKTASSEEEDDLPF